MKNQSRINRKLNNILTGIKNFKMQVAKIKSGVADTDWIWHYSY